LVKKKSVLSDAPFAPPFLPYLRLILSAAYGYSSDISLGSLETCVNLFESFPKGPLDSPLEGGEVEGHGINYRIIKPTY